MCLFGPFAPMLWIVQEPSQHVSSPVRFLLGFVLSIHCVESARHDHEGQVPKQQRHLRLLLSPSVRKPRALSKQEPAQHCSRLVADKVVRHRPGGLETKI
jgi:hypothetical protein